MITYILNLMLVRAYQVIAVGQRLSAMNTPCIGRFCRRETRPEKSDRDANSHKGDDNLHDGTMAQAEIGLQGDFCALWLKNTCTCHIYSRKPVVYAKKI